MKCQAQSTVEKTQRETGIAYGINHAPTGSEEQEIVLLSRKERESNPVHQTIENWDTSLYVDTDYWCSEGCLEYLRVHTSSNYFNSSDTGYASSGA